MDETQTAEAESENAMALPMLKSVYSSNGLRKITSVPLQTYNGIPIAVITIIYGFNNGTTIINVIMVLSKVDLFFQEIKTK